MNEHETQQAEKLLGQLCQVIIEVVAETPNGAPCGAVYAALMTIWPEMTALQFNMLIAGLEAAGKLVRFNHCLYPPDPLDPPLTAAEQAAHIAEYGTFDQPAERYADLDANGDEIK